MFEKKNALFIKKPASATWFAKFVTEIRRERMNQTMAFTRLL